MLFSILRPFIRMALTLGVLVWFVPTISVASWMALVLASIVLTLLYMLAKPILNLIFLPVNMVTLGLFSLIINVALLWIVMYLVPGFNIAPTEVFGVALNGFLTLIFVSFLISLVNGLVKVII